MMTTCLNLSIKLMHVNLSCTGYITNMDITSLERGSTCPRGPGVTSSHICVVGCM